MPATWPLGGTMIGRLVIGIHHLDPRVVQRRELRVVAGGAHAPVQDVLRDHPGRAVEDRHPVAHVLAVGDHLALQVADLDVVAVGAERPDVGHDDHGHLVHRGEAAHALPLGDVTLELRGGHLLRAADRGAQREAAGGGDPLGVGEGRAGLLDRDQLRGRVDLGGDVRAALLEGQPLVLLALRSRGDDDLEGRLFGRGGASSPSSPPPASFDGSWITSTDTGPATPGSAVAR